MNTKYGKVGVYREGLSPKKLHDRLSKWSCERSRENLNTYFYLQKTYEHVRI